MRIFLLFLILTFCFFSCNNTKENKANGTYFAGVIENPRGEYLILSHNDQVIDTIQLDKDNTFSYRNDSLCDGLYTFKHREYQRFYINKNDSLLIHLNTIDFDESLMYSGIGAEKNNLLMKIFLENELAQKKLPEWFELTPDLYLSKLDSVDKIHKRYLNKYIKKIPNTTSSFKQVVDANLKYDLNLLKELYISANLINGNPDIQNELPKAFLKHRNDIDHGSDVMRSHYSYYRFMNNYYNNVAYERYKEVDSFDQKNFTHANTKLDVIKEKTNHELLSNKLLRRTAIDYLLHTTDEKKAIQLYEKFAGYSTSKKDINQIKSILDQTLKMVPGKSIPKVQLVSLDNQTKTLREIIVKPTVIYFWTYESTKHYREVHEKAKELREKYSDYDFIAINADDNFRKWRRIAEVISTDKNTEYQLDNLPSAKSVLILDNPERTIIVNRKGEILNSNTAITDLAFEDAL